MPVVMLGLLLGMLIGLLLGLLGGGGSILTVPALVYMAGQSPQAAVTTSLAIVGTNSAIGAYFHRAQGTLNWQVALVFGGAGMGTAYLAAGFSGFLSQSMLLVMFALLMLAVGAVMLFYERPEGSDTRQPSWSFIVLSGAIVGVLTGFLGVGGGFLIVPALVMLVGLPIQQAVGTSLVIIAMNSLAGLAGHLDHVALDIQLTLVFIFAGIIGTLIGTRLSKQLQPNLLRQIFAVFVLGLALLLLYDNLL